MCVATRMKYSVFILLTIGCGLTKASLKVTGENVDGNGGTIQWGQYVPGPVYVENWGPTNDASLSQASEAYIQLDTLSGVWLHGPTTQEESAKMTLHLMSTYDTQAGASLVQGKSASISMQGFCFLKAREKSALIQEESASIALKSFSWLEIEYNTFKQGKSAKLTVDDLAMFYQHSGAKSFYMGDNSVISVGPFSQFWFDSDLTLGTGAKLIFLHKWAVVELHDQLSIGPDASIIFSYYAQFWVTSCGGVSCTIGSNSSITIWDSAQLNVHDKQFTVDPSTVIVLDRSSFVEIKGSGEFSLSNGASLTAGQGSILSLYGTMYLQSGSSLTAGVQASIQAVSGSMLTLQKASILVAGVQASIVIAGGSRLTLLPGVKLDVGKSAQMELKPGATLLIMSGSVTVSELARLIVEENMMCYVNSDIVVRAQTTLIMEKDGGMPSGVTCLLN